MPDTSGFIGQAIEYHNDPELAVVVYGPSGDGLGGVDQEFESATGAKYDHAVSSDPSGELAGQWVQMLQQAAKEQVEWWMKHDDYEMPTPDAVAEQVVRVDPANSEQVVLWFGQQLEACREAVRDWRFATAARMKDEFMQAYYKWVDG